MLPSPTLHQTTTIIHQSTTAATSSSPTFMTAVFESFALHFSPVIVIGALSFLSSFYLGLLTFGDSVTFYLMLNVLKTFFPSLVDFSKILPPVPDATSSSSPSKPHSSLSSAHSGVEVTALSPSEAEQFKFVVLLLSIRGLFNCVAMVRLSWKEAKWDFLRWCAPVLTVSTCAGVFILDHFGESAWLHPVLGMMLGGSGISCLGLRLKKQYFPNGFSWSAATALLLASTTSSSSSNKKKDKTENDDDPYGDDERWKNASDQNNNTNNNNRHEEMTDHIAREFQASASNAALFGDENQIASNSSPADIQNCSSSNFSRNNNNTNIHEERERKNNPNFFDEEIKDDAEPMGAKASTRSFGSLSHQQNNTSDLHKRVKHHSSNLLASHFFNAPSSGTSLPSSSNINTNNDDASVQQHHPDSLDASSNPNKNPFALSPLTSPVNDSDKHLQHVRIPGSTTSAQQQLHQTNGVWKSVSSDHYYRIQEEHVDSVKRGSEQQESTPKNTTKRIGNGSFESANDVRLSGKSGDLNSPTSPGFYIVTTGSQSSAVQKQSSSSPGTTTTVMTSRKGTPILANSTVSEQNGGNGSSSPGIFIVESGNDASSPSKLLSPDHSVVVTVVEASASDNNSRSEETIIAQFDEDAEARKKLSDPYYMQRAKFFFVLSCIPSGIAGGICEVASVGFVVVVAGLEFPKTLARGTLPLCFLWILIIRSIYTFFAGEFIVVTALPEFASVIVFGVAGTAAGNAVGRIVNNDQFLMSVVVMMIVGGLSLGSAPFWILAIAFVIGTAWVGRSFWENKSQMSMIMNTISGVYANIFCKNSNHSISNTKDDKLKK